MPTIDITAVSRLKHADLHKAVKKLGSQAAVAQYLGVHQADFSKWCNLKGGPSKTWSAERLLELETKLLKLTGKTLEELFPAELLAAEEFLRAPKTFEKTKTFETSMLLEFAERQELRLTYESPEEQTMILDAQETVQAVLQTLPEREREVLAALFGIGCKPMNYEQLAKRYEVCHQRIRQIEKKAIENMRKPGRVGRMADYAKD